MRWHIFNTYFFPFLFWIVLWFSVIHCFDDLLEYGRKDFFQWRGRGKKFVEIKKVSKEIPYIFLYATNLREKNDNTRNPLFK